jgi:predicted O-linked N-acetylglucosamine transferase (SPINDLY family)
MLVSAELPAFVQASILFQKGFRAEAGAICRNILASNPADSEALHLLGVIQSQGNDAAAALDLIDRAISLNPANHRFHLSRSIVLQQLSRLDEALDACDCALRLKADYARALNNRGALLHRLCRPDDALASYDRAIAIDSRYADALVNRGVLLHERGLFKEALSDYDRAISIRPAFPEALHNRGLALQRLGRFPDALDSFDRAIHCKPDYAEALKNRGFVLHRLGRFAEAIDSYNAALAIAPDFPEALNNLGVTLHRLNRFEEAVAVYDRALALDPRFGEALCNRGQVLLVGGQTREAMDMLRRATAISDSPAVHSAFIFGLNFDPSATGEIKQAERRNWAKRYGDALAPPNGMHSNSPDPDRRLRIGYISSYFRRNAATYSFGGVITCRDRNAFEVFCYSDTTIHDDVTELIRGSATAWRETFGMSDEQLADTVRRDEVDVLVDLVGHMAGNRLPVFARKPAPVQITGWGEPTGTGLAAMDFLLADRTLVPDSERILLAEQVIRLSNFLGYWVPDTLPGAGPLPAAERGYVTFGSFNRIEKLSDQALSTWAELLRKTQTARLVLKDRALENAAQRGRITKFFAENGVSADRLTLMAESDRPAHFAAYQQVDIALDPFPHSGGMTTLDAFWMGVPVISFPGETISSRLAASSLSSLGLDSFIARDLDGYVDLALEKATDIQALSALRPSLRGLLATSEFGDPARYCRAVEAGYRNAWRQWCAAKTAKSIHHD